jgi:hypothetical protein
MFSEVIDSGRLFGGQYLYVVAELSMLKQPVIAQDDRVHFPEEFTKLLRNGTEQQSEVNKSTAIWGGASKGVIFALLKERAGQPVDTVIDINPAKQGKHLPATGLLVQSPTDAFRTLPKGSTIYVMNSNYLEEIKKMSKHAYHYISVDHG